MANIGVLTIAQALRNEKEKRSNDGKLIISSSPKHQRREEIDKDKLKLKQFIEEENNDDKDDDDDVER